MENLFDTIDDPDTLDDDFTPKGKKRWSKKRYTKKIFKLAKTISEIGSESSKNPAALIGVAEVENINVLKDLISAAPLKDIDYGIVHYDSPDERGIDTALLYHKEKFEVIYSKPIMVLVYEENGQRDKTRDILYVKGKLNGELVHIFVNHWPSKREGEDSTSHKRLTASNILKGVIQEIEKTEPNPNIIVMGDFNDGPKSESIKSLMEIKSLFNPMDKLKSPDRGSANYKKQWSLYDQIIFSHNFLNYEKGTHSFTSANIFDDTSLKEWKGKFKDNPYRTYVGGKYLGGYSDHFPVYVQFAFNKKNKY